MVYLVFWFVYFVAILSAVLMLGWSAAILWSAIMIPLTVWFVMLVTAAARLEADHA